MIYDPARGFSQNLSVRMAAAATEKKNLDVHF